mmetsp:Transcript_16459/g.49145  ORF Transcript_16459/g.49145 Transcript_16459/m.49145 type:complete len:102 (-) Transcript_16459:37-342(-)|eukprot:CAMPEP_0119259244 /NCGR_PEP_ID=MMETSP1329-20130426/141_1 /TAXON_ID=114041 /ORGANISM="Genus nov. species nov., Strain RCC1024" /LENGTH=101 /DNA_ID=CAMNT_0007258613 /DNA_START=142 /DNA_END=447 /DNA_ORIENTATION=+
MSKPDIDYSKTRFPYADTPPEPYDHSQTAGGITRSHLECCLGCQERQKEMERLEAEERRRGVDYRAEQDRLAALPQEEQDRVFWAKFGMTGPPPRERGRLL